MEGIVKKCNHNGGAATSTTVHKSYCTLMKTDFEFQNVKKSFKRLQILLFIFLDLKSIQNSINEKSLV